jgi:hypothetical protein
MIRVNNKVCACATNIYVYAEGSKPKGFAMPKIHKSFRLDRNTVAQIEALAFKEDRTFSAMADKLLREGIEARSVQKTKPTAS